MEFRHTARRAKRRILLRIFSPASMTANSGAYASNSFQTRGSASFSQLAKILIVRRKAWVASPSLAVDPSIATPRHQATAPQCEARAIALRPLRTPELAAAKIG